MAKGVKDDIIERKDEYRSALGDIAQDLANGEIPGEKIAKLVTEGAYNGCTKGTLQYIENIMNTNEKFKDRKFLKGLLLNLGKYTQDVGRDFIFQKKDLKTSLIHNGYKRMTNPFEKWIDKNLDDNIFVKHFAKATKKTIDDMACDLLATKAHLFKINGEFNNKLIDDFVHNFEKNYQDEAYKGFIEALKKEAKRMKENARKKD